MEGVDLHVLVCREEDVVDVRDESLKSFVVVFVRGPGLRCSCCRGRCQLELRNEIFSLGEALSGALAFLFYFV